MLEDADEAGLSAPAQELVRLLRVNRRSSVTEMVMRLRALLDISEDLATTDLMMAAAALRRASSQDRLQPLLETCFTAPAAQQAA